MTYCMATRRGILVAYEAVVSNEKRPKVGASGRFLSVGGSRLAAYSGSDCECRADLVDVRLHDLRHTFASAAVAMAESLPMIGKPLGHSQVQTTAH